MRGVKSFSICALVGVALLAITRPASAEVDPRCGNTDVYSDAVQTSRSEMLSYVAINDLNLARAVYENGIHMALTAYTLVNTCGGYNATEVDAGLADLVESAYTDHVASARESYGWMRAILSTAYTHGDTEEEIERWSAFEQQLELSLGHHPQQPQRY